MALTSVSTSFWETARLLEGVGKGCSGCLFLGQEGCLFLGGLLGLSVFGPRGLSVFGWAMRVVCLVGNENCLFCGQ